MDGLSFRLYTTFYQLSLQNYHKFGKMSTNTREGVYAPGGPAFLAYTKQKLSNIVGLTALRLAFFMGYE